MEEFVASGMHWKLLNFFIFVSLLFAVLKKPVAEFWRTRAHQISFSIEEARRLRQEAGKKVLEMEGRIKGLDDEIDALVRSLREEGEQEKEKILIDSRAYAERLKRDAKRIVQQEFQKTKEQLKQELVDLSIQIAERQIRDQIQDSDQKKLSEKFVKELEAQI